MNDLEAYERYRQLQTLIDHIKRVSFYANETQKRYPYAEAMTQEELEQLTRIYLAMFLDVEDIYKEFKKIYAEYKKK